MSPSSIRDAVLAIPWLRRISAATVTRLASQAVMHRVPAGAVLFEQSEQPSFATFLLSGSVELLGVRNGTETLIELLRPIDMVIPAAVISRRPYLMRARVHDEAQFLLIPAALFRSAVSDDPLLCQAVLGCLAAQFRRQVRHNKNVRLRSAEERVGCHVTSLLPPGASGAAEIRLPVGKALIASQLGMTRETFSRALGALRRVGVTVRGERLLVADAAALAAAHPLDPMIDAAEEPEAFS